ncbi:MAG TPA: penicillin-binding protein 2 [Patescibacteria group bacterium]|nr:penicillin-binding protein 2 [Patescibacteria group bacterium]
MSDLRPFNIKGEGDKTGRMKHKYRMSWVEDSFHGEVHDATVGVNDEARNYVGRGIPLWRIVTALVIFALGIGIVLTRVFTLQIIQGREYRDLAEGNRIRLRPIPSERGIIYDRFGKELVQNIPSFSLAIVPQDLPKDKEKRELVVQTLSTRAEIPEEDIKNLLEKYKNYSYESLVVKENLPYDTALKLYVENADLPGVLVESGTKRKYLNSTSSTLSLSHVLGYLSKLNEEELSELKSVGYLPSDNIGKSGLEKNFEAALRGEYGKKKIEVNALGHEQNVLAEEAPHPGNNLYLSLDLEAQSKLEEIAKAHLIKVKKEKIAAIALNPENGEILAMVNLPSFDSNDFSGGITNENYQKYTEDKNLPLFNRTIAGTYPPGSTIKLIVSAAALQEGIVNYTTVFNSVGGLRVGSWFFKDWKAGGHGITNVTKAIAWSVNTFYYYVGGGYNDFVGLGIDRLTKYFKMFNLSEITGIDIPGEKTGFIPSETWKKEKKNERWYIGDTYNISIGQGDLLVTPLRVALWTSIVGNGGKIVTPHFGVKLTDPITKAETILYKGNEKKVNVNPSHLGIVQQGMRECVTIGSCKLLQTLPFQAGGKTGTAQWSSTKDTHAWFTSLAPYDDPKIVVTVMVEEGGEGATAAMPIARDFLAWWGKKYLTP